MSFSNKTNGREYVNKSNSNTNKVQTMSYRNSLTNAQYINSSNGDSYSYEDKSQNSSNSPKSTSEIQQVPQHSTYQRESYACRSNISRNKQYNQIKSCNDRPNNYYSQSSCSQEIDLIPEIDHLRDFIKEQTALFKMELSNHEGQKSSDPSPSGYQYNDQSNYKYSKPYGSLKNPTNGIHTSHSLGSIANSNNNVQSVQTLTVSPSCTDSSNRHPDARMSQGSLVVNKGNNNVYGYNKHYMSTSGKPSPGLTRNLSHEDAFTKPTLMSNNKNTNDTNNIEKLCNSKTQFPSPTGSFGNRQDSKKTFIKTKPYTFVSGANPAMYQLNQNNSVPSNNEISRNDYNHHQPQQHQQSQNRHLVNNVVRNGFTNGCTKTASRRRVDNRDNIEAVQSNRAVVSIADNSARRLSHSGSSTTDSQDVNHCSTIDTTNTGEQFFTPDPSASPCSTRSSPDTATTAFPYPRTQRKPLPRVVTSNSHE